MPAPPAGFPKRSPSTTLVHQLGTDGVVFYVLFKYITLEVKQKFFLNVPHCGSNMYPGPPGEQPNAVTIEQFGLQL